MTAKVGVLIDFAWAYPDGVRRPVEDSLQLAFDDALEDGVIDKPIEMVTRVVGGLPVGSAFDVLNAWKELAHEEGCVAILGPISSENALAIRDYVEHDGRVPSITWGGTKDWNGVWCYTLNQGSWQDEPYLMTNYLAHRGVRRVAAVMERNVTGDGYLQNFRRACDFDGLQIVHTEEIGQQQSDLDAVVARLRDSGAEAIAYFGFGLPAVSMSASMRAIGWDPIRVITTAFCTAPLLPGGWKVLRGWVGCDLHDDENVVGRDFLDRFEQRFGYRPENYIAVNSYDTGQLLARGVGNARPLSPDGVRRGLDSIAMLPAASGAPGTMLGFGPHAHNGWVGTGYLVLSRVRDGFDAEGLMSPGSTEVVHRMTPRSRTERRGTRHEVGG